MQFHSISRPKQSDKTFAKGDRVVGTYGPGSFISVSDGKVNGRWVAWVKYDCFTEDQNPNRWCDLEGVLSERDAASHIRTEYRYRAVCNACGMEGEELHEEMADAEVERVMHLHLVHPLAHETANQK